MVSRIGLVPAFRIIRTLFDVCNELNDIFGASDSINFLLASQARYTCTEAARNQPNERPNRPSYDAFTRILHRTPQDTGTLWAEAEPMAK